MAWLTVKFEGTSGSEYGDFRTIRVFMENQIIDFCGDDLLYNIEHHIWTELEEIFIPLYKEVHPDGN